MTWHKMFTIDTQISKLVRLAVLNGVHFLFQSLTSVVCWSPHLSVPDRLVQTAIVAGSINCLPGQKLSVFLL